MHHVAVLIRQNLNLDVSSNLDIFFDVDGWIAERLLRLVLRGRQSREQLIAVPSDAHPATTPAGGRFYDDRIADGLRYASGFFFVFDDAVKAGSYRNAD